MNYPRTHNSSPVIQALNPGEVFISVEIWFLQLKHWAWTEYCPKNMLPFTKKCRNFNRFYVGKKCL